MPSTIDMLTGLWKPRMPFIAGPDGRNVAADYMAGGKYSSQASAPLAPIGSDYMAGGKFSSALTPPLATVGPAGTPNPAASLTGAWQNRVPATSGSTTGMPANLATIAQRNLAKEDATINRFNFTARFASSPPVTPNASSTVGTGSLRSFVQNYQPAGMSKPYHEIVSATRWGSGL